MSMLYLYEEELGNILTVFRDFHVWDPLGYTLTAGSPGGYRRQLVPIAATSEPLNQPLCRDSWRATSCPFLRSLLLNTATPLPFCVSSIRFPRPLTTPSAVTSWRPFYHHTPTFHSFHQSATILGLRFCSFNFRVSLTFPWFLKILVKILCTCKNNYLLRKCLNPLN